MLQIRPHILCQNFKVSNLLYLVKVPYDAWKLAIYFLTWNILSLVFTNANVAHFSTKYTIIFQLLFATHCGIDIQRQHWCSLKYVKCSHERINYSILRYYSRRISTLRFSYQIYVETTWKSVFSWFVCIFMIATRFKSFSIGVKIEEFVNEIYPVSNILKPNWSKLWCICSYVAFHW